MPALTINGHPVSCPAGATLLDAAANAGVVVPTLCHHQDLSTVGSCRLCLVEIAGTDHLLPACHTAATHGLTVLTDSPRVLEARRMVLRLLAASGSIPSPSSEPAAPGCRNDFSRTEFAHWLREYDIDPHPSDSAATRTSRFPVGADPSPFLHVNMNLCILCTRCVRACAEVQGNFVWGVAERGHDTHIVAGAETTLDEAGCVGCGACVAYCPTGALADRPSLTAPLPDRKVTTTCAYCGIGCQFDLEIAQNRVVGVASNPQAPVNGMHMCAKGRYGFGYIHHPDRLSRPRVREELLRSSTVRNPDAPRGAWVDVDWDTALDLIARRFVAIRQETGPDALSCLSSAKCSNEENYLVQKLARQVLGTSNIDHCARLCHSSTVAGLSMAIGSGAMSNSLDDLAERAALFFVIGSNTTEQHPVFGSMLRQAVLQRGAKLIVADPRRIDLVDSATLHLQHRPGTDIALVNGLMRLILEANLHDSEFIETRTENFEVFCRALEAYTVERVSDTTGVPIPDLIAAAQLLGQTRPGAVIWAMGITQHVVGVMNVLALANLQLLLGNFGVPGSGVNPLRGQNNVQGACDMGALPNVLPGYQSLRDAAIRSKFQAAWELSAAEGHSAELPSYELPAADGLTLTEIIGGAGNRSVRGLYILGENPVLTDPDSAHVRRCLGAAEFVVVQEIFPSATSEYADVLLPGTSFAERTGTFTNTERRIQTFNTAVSPPGDARPDWWIIQELGRRCLELQGLVARGPLAAWSYGSPAEIMDEIRQLTPSYAGVTYERLLRGDRLQWPVPGPDLPGTPILHTQTFPRGRGRFHVVEDLPPAELPDESFPFLLTTGRVLYHWHAGEMTRRASPLMAAYPAPLLEIAPDDAERLQVSSGDSVLATSRRGTISAIAFVTDRVSPGIVFGTFHFPAAHNVNELTLLSLDPLAKIPEYKVCAIQIARADVPQQSS